MTIINNKLREKSYSQSVNIIRDFDADLQYIVTPNSDLAFTQLINSFKIGIRCFSIVGAYGTGKSSFLIALKKTLNRENNYFNFQNNYLNNVNFKVMLLIGDYKSFTDSFAEQLNLENEYTQDEIIFEFEKHYKEIADNNKGLLILVDEFGKYLEYAAQNNPEKELYFLQKLAEHINDISKNIFLITTLHQDFNGYSYNLSKSQQNEWDKVKGRLKEITFNEPVEQLLFLAAERLKNNKGKKKPKNFSVLLDSINKSKTFPLKDYFDKTIAESLLPFDILAASVLTIALQKYGQNERSLFSFIESDEPFGLNDFKVSDSNYYNLNHVYNYLIHNYYSFITTKYNPHFTQWAAIQKAIERVESVFEENVHEAIKILKTIGLLNIFANAGAVIDNEFINEYGQNALSVKKTNTILEKLKKEKIVRFVQHSKKYILFEGTDLDIELAIDEAGNLVERVSNVVYYLNNYFTFPVMPAKAAFYKSGTPRFFCFRLSETPEHFEIENEYDGIINLIFDEKIDIKYLKEYSKNCKDAILFGLHKNTSEIKNLIFEIEKVKKVKENNIDDKVAVKELEGIIDHQIKLLNHYVVGNLYSGSSQVEWFFAGKEIKISNRKTFNRELSNICEKIYNEIPIYRNELVNKHKLSVPISTARKNFIKAMVDNWTEKDFAFDEDKFPPEKTIYLSLLWQTGIHKESDGGYELSEPTEKSFRPLWNVCTDFLESTRKGKRNLSELFERLSSRPFKLKKGFIDFWIPIFLFIKRNDYALFGEEKYIPYITEETLDLIGKNPKPFEIKAFDIEGVKLNLFNRYRALLSQSQKENISGKSFIETIKPFLVFYKQLPEYAKKTKRLNKKTIQFREMIALAKDPEESFFESFPKAMGYSLVQLEKEQKLLEEYVEQLENSIREIRTCFDDLIGRFESYILNEVIGEPFNFPEYKFELQNRFRNIKEHLLLQRQKVFYQRIFSELDDKKLWLSSIAQACIGKSLDVISDKDEKVLYDKFSDLIHELDNLCELDDSDKNNSKEEIYKLELTSYKAGNEQAIIRIPKSKKQEIIEVQKRIQNLLGKNKQVNSAALIELLKQQIKNEE
jgi:hypothetical protein